MPESMLGSSGEDLGLVIDFVTKLRHGGSDFRERAKKLLRMTLFTLAHGDGMSKEILLAIPVHEWRRADICYVGAISHLDGARRCRP